MTPLYDMHCHLGFAPDAPTVAAGFAQAGAGAFSCGVEPHAYPGERALFAPWPCVRVGLGLHPWWAAAAGEDGLRAFEQLAADAPFVGEVGLDRGARHGAGFPEQLAAFRRVARALAAHPGKVVSIHAVRAVDEVLDCLEEAGALAGNTCVLHWFSGTSQQLSRALRAGLLVSMGEPMLATRRGAAYARQVPPGRLLLETDYPPQDAPAAGFAGMRAPLERAAGLLAAACGEDAVAIATEASRRLLALANGCDPFASSQLP